MAIHHAIPFLLGELVDRVAASQTRVVDQDVQPAEGLNSSVDGASCALHRDDAVRSRDRFATGRANLIGDVRCRAAALRVATDIAHDDLGTLLGRQERLAASDSSAAAGDDRNLACQALITGLGHGRFSLSSPSRFPWSHLVPLLVPLWSPFLDSKQLYNSPRLIRAIRALASGPR